MFQLDILPGLKFQHLEDIILILLLTIMQGFHQLLPLFGLLDGWQAREKLDFLAC